MSPHFYSARVNGLERMYNQSFEWINSCS